MRSTLLLTAALMLAVPSVAAQDGCDEADPCIWVVEVDETELAAPGGELEGTVGDWYVFEFLYVGEDPDAPEHTVVYDGTGDSWTLSFEEDYVESQPFQLTDEGSFTLADDVSGDTLPVRVTFDDVSGTTTTDGQDSPGLGLLAALAALGVVLGSRRR